MAFNFDGDADFMNYEAEFGGGVDKASQGGTPTPPTPPVQEVGEPQAPTMQNNPQFRELPRHLQIKIEQGQMTLDQAMGANQAATPQAPAQPEPTKPATGKGGATGPSPQAPTPSAGRPGLTSEDLLQNKGFGSTFAKTGSKEAAGRGLTGALFSKKSLFGERGSKPNLGDAALGAVSPNAAFMRSGMTLTPSMAQGGGIAFDGGLSGWPGANQQNPEEDRIMQMITQALGGQGG